MCIHIIRAAAVLHNLSIENDINFAVPENIQEENENFMVQDINDANQDDRNGTIKRNEVMNSLPFQI